MKIVTGARGEAHITSNDDQGLHQGIFGAGNYILNVGQKLEASLTDANTVSISDGEGVMQGVHFRVLPGTVDTVTIDSGTTGYNRIDLICARYTKDADTGIENVEWVVVKGTPSESTPEDPEVIEGDILGGDLSADFPMFRITITGLTPAIEALGQESSSSADCEEAVEEVTETVTTLINGFAPTIKNGTAVSLTSSAWLLLDHVELEAGTYLVIYGAGFASNSSGVRGIYFGTNDTVDRTGVSVPAANGESTRLNASKFINVATKTNYILYGYQSSGNALSTSPYLHILKLPSNS